MLSKGSEPYAPLELEILLQPLLALYLPQISLYHLQDCKLIKGRLTAKPLGLYSH